MFLKTVMALTLCAAPLHAQDWQLAPASLPVQADTWSGGGGLDVPDWEDVTFGAARFSRDGRLCVDIPGGRGACELAVRSEGLMLVDRESQGRIRVRLQFGIRP